jgi:hypothetical protein
MQDLRPLRITVQPAVVDACVRTTTRLVQSAVGALRLYAVDDCIALAPAAA